MSDGMSDASAVGGLAQKLEFAAMDLRDAIKAAKNGHRGLCPPILETVNEHLRGTGYRLSEFRYHEEP